LSFQDRRARPTKCSRWHRQRQLLPRPPCRGVSKRSALLPEMAGHRDSRTSVGGAADCSHASAARSSAVTRWSRFNRASRDCDTGTWGRRTGDPVIHPRAYREELLDRLAWVYARAAVDEYMAQQRQPSPQTSDEPNRAPESCQPSAAHGEAALAVL